MVPNQIKGLAPFLMAYCNGDKVKAGTLLGQLYNLKDRRELFTDSLIWSASRSMSPIAW